MKAIYSRVSYFLRGVSKDTHIWSTGVMLGAILLSISFFLEPEDREFLMMSHTVNAAERATAFVIPDCFNVGSVIVPDDSLLEDDNTIKDELISDTVNSVADSTEYIQSLVTLLDSVDVPLDEQPASDALTADGNGGLNYAEALPSDQLTDVQIPAEAVSDLPEVSVAEENVVEDSVIVPGAFSNPDEIETAKLDDPSITAEEYEALVKIVASEANTEDMIGKILITNVIVNRVNDDNFPDDIISVITEKGQFSPVKRGGFDLAVMDDDSMEAVVRALNGEDYSEGALYFQKSKSTKWGNKKYLFRHGQHSFYK